MLSSVADNLCDECGYHSSKLRYVFWLKGYLCPRCRGMMKEKEIIDKLGLKKGEQYATALFAGLGVMYEILKKKYNVVDFEYLDTGKKHPIWNHPIYRAFWKHNPKKKNKGYK